MSILGLPSLPASVVGLFTDVALLAVDAVLGFGSSRSQWGIFLNGSPVVIADNVLSLEYRQDFSISNDPLEQGAFNSYNKVQRPFEIKLRFSTGGNAFDRQAMINSIKAIIGDTNLYDVVTPEAIYTNVNLIHQDYRRSSDTAGLIIIDVWCQEVRSATLTSSNTTSGNTAGGGATPNTPNSVVANDFAALNQPQNPGASPVANGGNVQAASPTTADNAQFTAALQAQGNPF